MEESKGSASRIERGLGVLVLLLLLLGCLLVLRPFVSALLWAIVLCFSLWPVYQRVLRAVNGRKTLGAFVMTSAIALVLAVPTISITLNLAGDAHDLAAATRRWVTQLPRTAPSWLTKIPIVGSSAASYWQELAQDAAHAFERTRAVDSEHVATSFPTTEPSTTQSTTPSTAPTTSPATQPVAPSKLGTAVSKVFAWVRSWLPAVGLAIAEGVTQVLLSVFLTFFLFRDGVAISDRLSTMLNKVAGERGTSMLNVAGATVRGVVYGIIGTAIVQGTIACIGFLIAGVPGAGLLGLATFFASPLPVGPPLIWLPAALWLFHEGRSGWGVFMLIWGLLVSGVDNFVKPWIISKGSAAPFILILCGVIGGALAFGFIGVFLGPTLLTVAYRLIEEWSRGPIAAASKQSA